MVINIYYRQTQQRWLNVLVTACRYIT